MVETTVVNSDPNDDNDKVTDSTNATGYDTRYGNVPTWPIPAWQNGMDGNWPPQPPKTRRARPFVAALLVGMMLIIGLLFVANSPASAATTTITAALATTTTSQVAVSGTALSINEIAKSVSPAVVQITTSQNVTQSGRTASGSSSSSTQVETGVGTGIIYDKAGYILTNAHVVEGASSLLVTLTDGTTYTGTLVGSDSQTDLAVVKIDPSGATLPVATLGNSSTLEVGDSLVAIGNALALPGGPTVTSGIVSALDRSVTEPASSSSSSLNAYGYSSSTTASGAQLYDLIQTDAAINPGNSGGPLLNAQGDVIGITTLIAGATSDGTQAQGIGFAISINQAKAIAAQLVASGTVQHAYVGISYQPLTPALAKSAGVSVTHGAVVQQVTSGSPAATAGLKAGDIIVSINGTTITGESQLGETISSLKPGDVVQLQVITPQSNAGTGTAHSVSLTLGQKTAS